MAVVRVHVLFRVSYISGDKHVPHFGNSNLGQLPYAQHHLLKECVRPFEDMGGTQNRNPSALMPEAMYKRLSSTCWPPRSERSLRPVGKSMDRRAAPESRGEACSQSSGPVLPPAIHHNSK